MVIVSVVIPTFNSFETTVQAVESVLNQSFSDLEVLIVDDCSTDGSAEKLRQYFKESNVKISSSTMNSGAATCRNLGSDMARGQFVAYLDSDDCWLPDKLDVQLNLFSTIADKGVEYLLYSPAILEYEINGSHINPARPIRADERVENYLFIDDQNIQTSGWLMTMETFRKIRFSSGLRRHQDLDFCLRAQNLGVRFVMNVEPLYKRGHASSRSHVGKIRDDGVSENWIRNFKGSIENDAYHKFCLETIFPEVVKTNPTAARKLVWDALADGVLRPGKTVHLYLRLLKHLYICSRK